MKELTISLPMLPPSITADQKSHRRRQREEEKKWQDYIASEWAAMGKPEFSCIHVTLIFSLPGHGTGAFVDYLATGSRFVGDAIKGLLIPDVGPEHLTAWNFRCESGDGPLTTIIIEEERKGHATSQRPDCNLYETCNTPLCPLDQISLEGIWYPDEDICHSRAQGNLPWVKAQKKIAESGAPANQYFNLTMLERNCIIKKGIAGLDPNETDKTLFKKWLADHPVKKEMSEEEKIARTEHLKKFQFRDSDKQPSKGGFGSDF